MTAEQICDEIILTEASYSTRRADRAYRTAPDCDGTPQSKTERVGAGRELPLTDHRRYRDELRSLYAQLCEAERESPEIANTSYYREALRVLRQADNIRLGWGRGAINTLEPIIS